MPRTFVGTLNRITTLIENPCDAPWWVYLKTAIPALGESLYMLIVPQPDEILEEYLDPRKTRGAARRGYRDAWRRAVIDKEPLKKRRAYGLRPPEGTGGGRGGGGGGGGGGGRRWGFPDPDGLIASFIPGVEKFASRRISPLEHIIWTNIQTVDRGLWYWLVYDAHKNFVYSWHSGIFESRYCSSPWSAAGSWHKNSGLTNLQERAVNPNRWVPDYTTDVDAWGEGFIQTKRTLSMGAHFWMSYSAPTTDPGRDITLKLGMGSGTEPPTNKEITVHVGPGESKSLALYVTNKGARNIFMENTQLTAASGWTTQGNVSFFGTVIL